jgi:predicted phosphodiesterase
MTRIAILADIHGNLPALDAALADLTGTVAPDQVIVNGDIVNRGPQSRECLQAIRATGWPVVFGNHEDYALKRRDGAVPEEWATPFWDVFSFIADEFSDEEIAYMRALPWHHAIEEPGLPAIRITHGSMRAINDGLGFWMSDEELLEAILHAPEPVVIGAHTHRTFERRVGERWALNCGAIGAPFNGNPDAQYLVMTARDGHWEMEFRSVPYDRAPVYAAWERTGYLKRSACAQIFKYELETATFHLKSYLAFCRLHGLDENAPTSVEQYRWAARQVPPGRSSKA